MSAASGGKTERLALAGLAGASVSGEVAASHPPPERSCWCGENGCPQCWRGKWSVDPAREARIKHQEAQMRKRHHAEISWRMRVRVRQCHDPQARAEAAATLMELQG